WSPYHSSPSPGPSSRRCATSRREPAVDEPLGLSSRYHRTFVPDRGLDGQTRPRRARRHRQHGKERPVRVEGERLLRFRAWAGGLAERRSAGDLIGAAWGGLQDTAPRSALLSLHARAAGVGPDSWADERLAQVWGPRLAVYLVPWNDYGVFTV